jgi:hypothetical protein
VQPTVGWPPIKNISTAEGPTQPEICPSRWLVVYCRGCCTNLGSISPSALPRAVSRVQPLPELLIIIKRIHLLVSLARPAFRSSPVAQAALSWTFFGPYRSVLVSFCPHCQHGYLLQKRQVHKGRHIQAVPHNSAITSQPRFRKLQRQVTSRHVQFACYESQLCRHK